MVLLIEYLYMGQITALTLIAEKPVTAQQTWLFASELIKMMQEHPKFYYIGYLITVSYHFLI